MLPGLAARRLFGSRVLVADWDDLWTDGGIYGDRPIRGLVARLNYVIDNWSERRLKCYTEGVTVVSEDLRQRCLGEGIPDDRILLLPNGAPIETIRPGQKAMLRQELGLPAQQRILIFCGWGQFDIELIFDALAYLVGRGVRPFVVFTGPNSEATLNAARVRGLEAQVRVAGLVTFDDLRKYLAAADVGLMPYADKALNRARWPIKVGDYLAAGLPIATCDVGEMGTLMRRWKVGRASAPEASSFAEAINALVSNRDLARLSARSREAAEAMSWNRLARVLEEFYLARGRMTLRLLTVSTR